MKLRMYQVDAFAERVFEGNPAAVVPLDYWLPEGIMQSVAAENNLSETAFFVSTGGGYHIRWFTPVREVKLCGHATLASAYVLFNVLGIKSETICFSSKSGPLFVARSGKSLVLDFPKQAPAPVDPSAVLIRGLGRQPEKCLQAEDYIAVYRCEEDVSTIVPEASYLKQLDLRGVIVTAPSRQQDFVARVFVPKYGILEDPVTGSAYTQLAPYWADRLGKSKLRARQLSLRGGEIECEVTNGRVLISGAAVLYMEATIDL